MAYDQTDSPDYHNDDPYSLLYPKWSTFGGWKDVESGQDDGQLMGGKQGRSYDPETKTDNPEKYLALDPKVAEALGLKGGEQIMARNAITGKEDIGIYRDSGPRVDLAKRLDMSEALRSSLGLKEGQPVALNLLPTMTGKLGSVPPWYGPNSDQQPQEEPQGLADVQPPTPEAPSRADIQQALATQPESASFAGEMQPSNVQSAEAAPQVGGQGKYKIVARDPQTGVITFADGTELNPTTRVMQQPVPGTNQVAVSYPGAKTPHYVNKEASPNEIKYDQNTGQYISIDKKTLQATPIQVPGEMPSIDPNLKGEDVLKALPPDTAADVKSMANYEYAKISSFAMKSPYYRKMQTMARQYNPDFDYRMFDTTQKAINDLATGRGSTIIMKSNEALGQVPNLVENINVLANDDSHLHNWGRNFNNRLKGGQPAQDIVNFEDSVKNFSSAAAAQLKGGNAAASTEEIGMHVKSFNTNASPSEQIGAVGQKTIAMLSQLAAEKQRALSGLGDKTHFQFKLIDDPSITAVQTLIGDPRIKDHTRKQLQGLLDEVAPANAQSLPVHTAQAAEEPTSDQAAYQETLRVMSTAQPGSPEYQQAEQAQAVLRAKGIQLPSSVTP